MQLRLSGTPRCAFVLTKHAIMSSRRTAHEARVSRGLTEVAGRFPELAGTQNVTVASMTIGFERHHAHGVDEPDISARISQISARLRWLHRAEHLRHPLEKL